MTSVSPVTSQVRPKLECHFSGFVTSASKISIISSNKANELAWIGSVSDICKYHFLCFVTIIQVKVISGHQAKKVNRGIELRYLHVLGQVFAKNTKNDPKTLFEASKSIKNITWIIVVKSRNDVKLFFTFFYFFYML